MKPRETGGNIPRRRQTPMTQQDKAVLAALVQSHAEHQGPPPLQPPPRTYYHRPKPSPLGQILNSAVLPHSDDADHLTRRQVGELKRNAYANARFPYTNIAQVAFANAAGDLERSVLPRAALETGGLEPRIHPGLVGVDSGIGAPRTARGWAFRSRNDMWLSPSAYLGDPQDARDTALHEFAHTRQSVARAPRSQIEGGADFLASALAEGMGAPEYQPAYPEFYGRIRRERDPFRAAFVR